MEGSCRGLLKVNPTVRFNGEFGNLELFDSQMGAVIRKEKSGGKETRASVCVCVWGGVTARGCV
jgi:hypothetical protein